MAMEMLMQDIEERKKMLKDCFVEVTESLELLDENEWDKKLLQMINSIKSARRDVVFIQKEKEEEQKRRDDEEKSKIKNLFDMQTPEGYVKVETNPKNVKAYELDKAFYMSLSEYGKIDIEYISAITSLSLREVIIGLGDAIYQNPLKWEQCFYKGYETKSEYLSGNIITKLMEAEKLNDEFKGYFDKNIKALRLVLPAKIPAEKLFISLGVNWIDGTIIEKFLKELFNAKETLKIYFDETAEEWMVECFNGNIPHTYNAIEYEAHSAITTTRYGTEKVPALKIVERTLKNQPIEVYDYLDTSTSTKKRVLNNKETLLALEKQKLIQQEFKKWIFAHPEYKDNIENTYYRRFGCVVARKFDGAFLQFPNKNPKVNLYDYQKNAIARIIETNNTLLAHDVGTGKTYVMIGAGMEMRRMGISKKNMYIVPNNIVGQWSKSFIEMYPKANILSISPQDFTPSKRDDVIKKIKENDYDGIIIAYSCFELVPMTTRYYQQEIREMLKKIECEITNERTDGSKYSLRKALYKKEEEQKRLLSKIEKEMEAYIPENCFDDLGINSLFVDEAHNFKNIGIKTKCSNLRGITSHSSQKCEQMMLKTKYVMDTNNGRGIIFATGTPICNSISDLYIMQQYLQAGELKMLELNTFDNWAAMFIEKSSEFEIDVDTNQYRKIDRLAKYNNLPELGKIISQVVDFYSDKKEKFTKFDGYKDIVVMKSMAQANYISKISERVDNLRTNEISRVDDNMLKVTVDGRKAALDIRLVEPNASCGNETKSFAAAECIWKIWKETKATNAAQLVFSDIGTPKQTFNVYNDLKSNLIALGVPGEEIAFVHDATTDATRTNLFNKTRSGEIRILIGSTQKLGIGVNVQERLTALHHLDTPWRPSDMVQREGRILRQGNNSDHISIYRYITDGSFDAYSWQILESKQRFISQILSNQLGIRSGREIDDVVLSYAEVKALAVGNPLIKERVNTYNELIKYNYLRSKQEEKRNEMKVELLGLPSKITRIVERIDNAKKDFVFYNQNYSEVKKKTELGEKFYNIIQQNYGSSHEILLGNYQDFEIWLPPQGVANKTKIKIKGANDYYIDIGDSSLGILLRIDNFLNSFKEEIDAMEKKLCFHQKNLIEIKKELDCSIDYSQDINKLAAKLKAIDKQLEVK